MCEEEEKQHFQDILLGYLTALVKVQRASPTTRDRAAEVPRRDDQTVKPWQVGILTPTVSLQSLSAKEIISRRSSHKDALNASHPHETFRNRHNMRT